MKPLLLLVVLCLTPGCFLSRTYVNEPLTTEQLNSLQPGQSSARDVVEALGAPDEVVQLGRRSAYRYEHSQRKLAGFFLVVLGFANQDTQADRTWVFFDENDVLSHVGTTLQAKDAEYAMPWTSHD